MKNSKSRGLGTLEGVFVPTLLTILGVIMYLRLGWIVGNAGLTGAVIIILIAHVITVTTSLSMSTMLTNIKIGPGGAYAIITRSLGMEMGGAIGIPLYFSQTISSAFYITGFTEVWVSFFPDHNMRLIGGITWLTLTVISVISAKLAFRLQYFILAAVILSVFSFIFGENISTGSVMETAGGTAGFWVVFAIFFPAVTGILTGATMSGELKTPGKSIIRGTMGAVITGLFVYLFLAFWYARQADPEMLITDTNIIFRLARYESLIIAGVMGAVLSSALSTLVSAPRTLNALGENRVIPFSGPLSLKTKTGQPINAIILSSILSLIVLVSGNLDSLAELLTMFFLTTYGMINLVVLIEQGTGITSFRPSFKLSILVPVTGTIGCFAVMLLINPLFSVITYITVILIYYYLKRREISSPWGDVRGSVFIALTEWAAQKIMETPYHPRIWKPSIVVPCETTENFVKVSDLLRSIVFPSGRIYYLSAFPEKLIGKSQKDQIDSVISPFLRDKIFVQKILVGSPDFTSVIRPVLQSTENSFLPPNSILFTVSNNPEKRQNLKRMLESVRNIKIALMCYYVKEKGNIEKASEVNIWLRDKSPNNDLAVLYALQMYKNLGVDINLCRAVTNENQKPSVEKAMKQFIEEARLPGNTDIKIFKGAFGEVLKNSYCDLTIMGMPQNYSHMMEVIENTPSDILFVSSRGMENILV